MCLLPVQSPWVSLRDSLAIRTKQGDYLKGHKTILGPYNKDWSQEAKFKLRPKFSSLEKSYSHVLIHLWGILSLHYHQESFTEERRIRQSPQVNDFGIETQEFNQPSLN